MRTRNSTTGQFQLGYITAEDDGTCNTFTAITSYDNNNSDWGVLRLTNISQFDVPATAHRMAFKWQGNNDLFIDNVEVALDFDCYPVSVLRYSEVAPHSVCLSWDVFDDSQTEWDVQVATDPDFTENVANHVADSIENYLLTGLNPNRYYHVRVKPTCNDSLWSNAIDFTTPSPTCNGAIEVTADEPYTEGFGYPQGTSWSTQGSLPPCWNKKSAYPGPHNTTGEAHSGTQALSFSNANAYAILPEFSNPLSELQISFWMETQYLGDFDELQLGYITADDNGTCNTFVAIATYNHTTSWVQRTTYLLNVPATAHRLAFKWNRDNRLCYIDDVEVSLAPDCYPVGNMSVGEVAYTSASLSWDLIDNSQTAWNVQVATNAAFTDVVADYVADSHENYLVEGLNSSTHYFVRVKSTSCGDDLWNTIEFWTLDYPCEGEITVTADAPYTQGFESPEGVPGSWAECPVPVCWGHYTTGNIIPHIVKYSGLNSTQCLMFYVNGDNYAILPEFSNPLDELQISFYMNMGSGTATLLLGYITAEDDGTCNTFTTIESYAPTNFTGFAQRITYLLNVPDTAHRLVFKKSGSYLCYIDDVEVSLAPDCYPVGNMSLGEVTSNSAYLSWDLVDDSQTAWDVQVSTDAAFTDTLAEYVADSHENYLLSGLSGGTHYYVRVRANCDDTHQSEWSDAIDFTTLCELIEITAETSYLESFESPEGTLWTQHGLLPPCWEGYSNTVNPAPHNTIDSYGAPSYAHSGEQCLSFHNSGGYAVLPELSNPLDELQISFWMRTEGSGSGELCLGYITAEDDGTCNTFTEIVSHGSNSGSMVQRTTYLPNVPATAHRLAFKWSATYYRCFVDDVEVSLAFDCYPVNNLNLGEVTSNSAYLSWDLVDDSQTAWDVQVSTDADFTNIVAEYEADSHENYLLEGLSHSTHYYVRVKPTCSDDLWSAIDFETPCGPFTVTANAPYTQDFEGVQGTTQNYWANGQVPACWEAYSAVSYAPHVVNNQGVYPTQTLAFYYNDNNYAALPEFSIPLNQLQIGFKMSTGRVANQNDYSGQLQLGYITAEDDNYSTFTAIAGYENYNYASLVERSTVLENVPSEAWRLVFKWSGGNMVCFIDDVEVSINPAMILPRDIAATNITRHEADITWEGACDSYALRYRVLPIFSEGFEGGTMPEGWTIEGASQNPAKTWRVGVGDNNSETGTHSGNYNALITYDTELFQEYTYLVMPALDLGESGRTELSFWYVNRKWGLMDYFAVCYRIGDHGVWRELWSTTASHATWTSQTVELTNLADDYQIGFRYFDRGGYGVGLDDIVISGLALSEWITVGEAESPHTLTGLMPETTYEVQVKSNCEGYEDWSASVVFTTLEACPVPFNMAASSVTATSATLAWEGFNDSYNVQLGTYNGAGTLVEENFAEAIPTDWDNSCTYPWTIVNGHMQSSNAGVHNSTSTISLAFALPIDGTIAFDAECKGEGSSTIYDKCIFSIDGEQQFCYGANMQGWNHYSFEVAAGQHTFTWSYTKDVSVNPNGDYFAVDNVVIVSGEYVWSEPVTTDGETYTVSGLQPNTLYEWKVQGICDGDLSEWSTSAYFTTEEASIFTKDIIAHTDNGGWYLIASPVAEAVTPTAQNGFLANEYDLYRFNQSANLEWENWKAQGEHYHFNLEAGQGYLYANSGDVPLSLPKCRWPTTPPPTLPAGTSWATPCRESLSSTVIST